jgi:hypothetical protein
MARNVFKSWLPTTLQNQRTPTLSDDHVHLLILVVHLDAPTPSKALEGDRHIQVREVI